MFRRDRRGTSAMEFGLSLPFAILLVCGLVDGVRLLNSHHTVARAVRDGARVGAITLEAPPEDGSEIQAAATDQVYIALAEAGEDTARFRVESAWVLDGGTRWIHVTVDYDWDPVFPGMSPFTGPVEREFWMITQEQ